MRKIDVERNLGVVLSHISNSTGRAPQHLVAFDPIMKHDRSDAE